MKLVGRLSRKVASKLDIEAIIARRKGARRRTENVVEPAVIKTAAPTVVAEIVENEIDLNLVIDAARFNIAWLGDEAVKSENVRCLAYGVKTYEELYTEILNEGRRSDDSYGYRRWVNTIQDRLEGKGCDACFGRRTQSVRDRLEWGIAPSPHRHHKVVGYGKYLDSNGVERYTDSHCGECGTTLSRLESK